MNKLFLLAAFLTFNLCIAMEEESIIARPLIYFTSSQVVYIGECALREQLEKMYGKKFPLNTIFFAIDFKDIEFPKTWGETLLSVIGLYKNQNPLPEFIPYEFIKYCSEDNYLTLELNGKKRSFKCCQKASKCWRQATFEAMVSCGYNFFVKHPNCLDDGKKSLFDQNVLASSGPLEIEHGQNGFSAYYIQ